MATLQIFDYTQHKTHKQLVGIFSSNTIKPISYSLHTHLIPTHPLCAANLNCRGNHTYVDCSLSRICPGCSSDQLYWLEWKHSCSRCGAGWYKFDFTIDFNSRIGRNIPNPNKNGPEDLALSQESQDIAGEHQSRQSHLLLIIASTSNSSHDPFWCATRHEKSVSAPGREAGWANILSPASNDWPAPNHRLGVFSPPISTNMWAF